MPLKDIVLYLGNKRASGTLLIDRGDVHKEARIHDGALVNSSSNQPREYLGQFLMNMGHLTEDQFMKAYETQKETKIFIGKILVMIGLVAEDVVKGALSLKLRETLLDAFTWPEGEFTFTPTEISPEYDGLDASVDLLDVHREGEFRETAWQAIRAVFPRGSLRLTVDERKLPEPPRPGTIDAKIVDHIREGHSIDDMALALHATDFYLYQRLYALYRLDAVHIDDSEPVEMEVEAEVDVDEPMVGSEVLGEEPSGSEIARAAKAFLDSRKFRDAESLARRAFEINPSSEHAQLLRISEQGLLAELRAQLTARQRVPTLMVPPSQLRSLGLSSAEKYLLSRIDGTRDVRSIVHVSPLQELEALKLIQDLAERKLVKLTP